MAVLAVVSSADAQVSLLDPADLTIRSVLEVAPQPHELAWDETRRRLYVSSTYRAGLYGTAKDLATEITIIDPDAARVVGVIDVAPAAAPHGLALTADGRHLVCTVEDDGNGQGGVLVIDLERLKPVKAIPVGAPGPHWVVAAPDGRTAWTSNKEAPFVSVVDLTAGELAARIPFPGGTEELALAGTRLYVTDRQEPKLHVVDTTTAATIESLTLAHRASPVHVAADGTVLVGLVRPADGLLQTYHPGPGGLRLTAECPVGAHPITIRTSPDSATAYVSALHAGTLDAVATATGEHLARLKPRGEAMQGAHGLAYITT